MSVTLSVIIVVLVMLVFGLMQLTPSVFSIFCHAMLSKKSMKKADDLMICFVLGAEFFVAAIWLLIYLVFFAFGVNAILWWVLAGAMMVAGLMFWLFYFRKSKGTELFVPKKWSKNLVRMAEKTRGRMDAFWLGFFTAVPELVFTLPLFAVSALAVQSAATLPRASLMIIFVIVAVAPLLTVYAMFRAGNNLADVMRLRMYFKPMVRITVPILFLVLAILSIGIGASA